MQEEAVATSKADLERLLSLNVLDYLMLMYVVYLKAINNMIPDHGNQMACLSQHL